ncbi:hypothetical protein KKC63_03370 [Patescibacteria group bacterium]|nr:hypothetical protein [Patescibacteria group bacterium]MBU4023284.1 hypothetical protein [Patescibacteria group bacterium]
MKEIILISCVSKKLNYPSKAKDLYQSPLFKYNLKYAISLNPDRIFILSAQYGLLDLEKEVDPYDKTLNKMKKKERIEWSKLLLNQLKKKTDLSKDKFTFLAGNRYREFLIEEIKNYQVPMEKLPIGRQLHWLKDKVRKI